MSDLVVSAPEDMQLLDTARLMTPAPAPLELVVDETLMGPLARMAREDARTMLST